MTPDEARRILAGELTVPWIAVEEAERVVELMERPREEPCGLEGCGKVSEVDGATGMALARGWLSEGRGNTRRYFCSNQHLTAHIFSLKKQGLEGER